MDYTKFKELATKYVVEEHGSLSVLSEPNLDVQKEVLDYMLKLMLKNCPKDLKIMEKARQNCYEWKKRFFDEYLN